MFTLPGSEDYGTTKEQQHRNLLNEKPNPHTPSDRDDEDSCTSHTDSSSKNKHGKRPQKS